MLSIEAFFVLYLCIQNSLVIFHETVAFYVKLNHTLRFNYEGKISDRCSISIPGRFLLPASEFARR